MVVFDKSVGDGISLAIRNGDINSEMIGEVIVYNFTYNKTAEFGIRLMPSAPVSYTHLDVYKRQTCR